MNFEGKVDQKMLDVMGSLNKQSAENRKKILRWDTWFAQIIDRLDKLEWAVYIPKEPEPEETKYKEYMGRIGAALLKH